MRNIAIMIMVVALALAAFAITTLANPTPPLEPPEPTPPPELPVPAPPAPPTPPVLPAQPENPAPKVAPVVKIESPRGGWTGERIIDVTGTVSDTSVKTLAVVVNGTPLTIKTEGGKFLTKIVLSPGQTTIQAIAGNEYGIGRDSVSLYADAPAKDLKITLTWDTNATDVDLHVTDPAGEVCFYSHKETKAGGNLDTDVTTGYGPETFTLAQAARGKYLVEAHYYSSHENAQTLCRLDVVEFEGTAREKHEKYELMLTRTGEKAKVAEVFVR
jgi:uncharacterized protein YfaP (DUF2135 family)